MRNETLSLLVDEFLNERHFSDQRKADNGKTFYSRELFADYDDTIGNDTIKNILSSHDPEQALIDQLDEWFMESRALEEDALFDEVLQDCFHGDLTEAEKDQLREYLQEVFFFEVPADYYLKQSVCINIMMDTGDGNYDFCLNSKVYPCWYGGDDHIIDPKASLLWLAKAQGYNKSNLQNALKKGDMDEPEGFLDSCRVELANLSSSMSTVTFLVKMTLAQAIYLNQLIKLQDRDGHNYDTTKNPDCGIVVLGKDVDVGLYDPWGGCGSVLEIQLEKDIKIPIRYIWTALPDGAQGCSIKDVYGTNESLWREAIKEFKVPIALKSLI